jgi:hypothetical protein
VKIHVHARTAAEIVPVLVAGVLNISSSAGAFYAIVWRYAFTRLELFVQVPIIFTLVIIAFIAVLVVVVLIMHCNQHCATKQLGRNQDDPRMALIL